MDEQEFPCHKTLYILKFLDADEAVCFAHDIWPDSKEWRKVYEVDEGGEWLFVISICKVCGIRMPHCIPAETYKDGIVGCECPKCGCYSLFPMEGCFRNA